MKKTMTGRLARLLAALPATLFGLACGFSASAEPLNYDYVYFSQHDTENDNTGKSKDSDVLGAFWEFTDTMHLIASYDSSGAYASGGLGADVETFRFGLGGHFLVSENTMIAPSLYAIRGRAELKDQTGPVPWNYGNDYTRTDTGYAVGLDLRYRVTNWFELTAGAKRQELFDTSSTDAVGGVVFHATDWLAFGALYHDREDSTGTELTVRWYF